jgi:hypothetical protein
LLRTLDTRGLGTNMQSCQAVLGWLCYRSALSTRRTHSCDSGCKLGRISTHRGMDTQQLWQHSQELMCVITERGLHTPSPGSAVTVVLCLSVCMCVESSSASQFAAGCWQASATTACSPVRLLLGCCLVSCGCRHPLDCMRMLACVTLCVTLCVLSCVLSCVCHHRPEQQPAVLPGSHTEQAIRAHTST